MRRRWLLVVAGQTLACGVVAGIVHELTLQSVPLGVSHGYLATPESGLAAVIGARYVGWVVVPAGVALYVLLPFAVAAAYSREDDRHPAFHLAWATAAVVALPLAFLLAVTALGPGSATGHAAGVAVPALAAAVLFAVHRVSLSRSPDGTDRTPPLAAFANVGVVSLLVGGMMVGAALAAPAGALVETYDAGPPVTNVEFSTEQTDDGTLLVATHAGGEPVEADRIRVVGSGFDDVAAADQTGPGRWRGDASGDSPRTDGPAVVEGDSVAVGVTDDCDVRLTYRFGGSRTTLARHECGADGN